MVNQETEQDLRAFQRRLMEISMAYEGPSRRMYWLIVLMVAVSSVNGLFWINHAMENNIPLSEMYWSRPIFTITASLTLLLFVLRFHKLADARNIIINNLRDELKPYLLDCTDTGLLIIKHIYQCENQDN